MSGYTSMYPSGTNTPQSNTAMAPEALFMSKRTSDGCPDSAENIVALQQVENLKYFLISAPVDWNPSQSVRKFLLPTGEYVSCVLWNNLFHITGTDIVRVLAFRFQAFGRPVKNSKKFEEGIFSDLRNLKAGTDASLEEPKSPFLDFLYKHNCIRTQKKQKVFYWYSVPHDRLFLDALERDLKRQRIGQTPTTVAVSEPALSFQYDTSRSLFDQLSKAQPGSTSVFNPHGINPSAYIPSAQLNSQLHPAGYLTAPIAQLEAGYDTTAQASIMGMMGLPSAPAVPQTVNMSGNGAGLGGLGQDDGYDNQIAMMSHMPTVAREYATFSSVEPDLPHSAETYQFGARDGSIISTQSHSLPGMDSTLVSVDPFQDCSHGDMSVAYSDTQSVVSSQFDPTGRRSVSVLTNGYPVHSTSSFSASPSVVWEGSPSYKQRRRKESLAAGYAAVTAPTNRSVYRSNSQMPLQVSSQNVVRSIPSSANTAASFNSFGSNFISPGSTTSPESYAGSTLSSSVIPCHNQALQSLETFSDVESLHEFQSVGGVVLNEGGSADALTPALSLPETAPPVLESRSLTPGIFTIPAGLNLAQMSSSASVAGRRARSATISALPTKCFTCPIPDCGRRFVKLEHLKRHRRSHDTLDALRVAQEPDMSGIVTSATMADLSSAYLNTLANSHQDSQSAGASTPLSGIDGSSSISHMDSMGSNMALPHNIHRFAVPQFPSQQTSQLRADRSKTDMVSPGVMPSQTSSSDLGHGVHVMTAPTLPTQQLDRSLLPGPVDSTNPVSRMPNPDSDTANANGNAGAPENSGNQNSTNGGGGGGGGGSSSNDGAVNTFSSAAPNWNNFVPVGLSF